MSTDARSTRVPVPPRARRLLADLDTVFERLHRVIDINMDAMDLIDRGRQLLTDLEHEL